MTIKQMVRISFFTSLICVITIVIPPFNIAGISMTLQTFGVMLAAILLKPSESFISLILYLFLGIIGIPVFSGFSSGLGVIMGPTGGFLLAFPLSALLISIFKGNKSFIRLVILNILFGIIFIYILGILSISIVNQISYLNALKTMLIFIPFDIVKAVVSAFIGIKLIRISTLFN